MTPIRKLLNRIHWDRTFRQADFLIGYLDRIENRIILAGLREICFPKDAPNSFEVLDAEGQRHRVPFHRVKEVYRNGERIWRRTH
ncbi:MAG TPA: DUF504 domain-containing protein [Patescibacteria group bacterium]|nr:DUF504 domain-containing protein [Patescibacteria group bacterium]